MRGWIYVAAADGASDRVRVGHAAADPGASPARVILHYDAVVDAPQETVRLLHQRLAALVERDGTLRCSPEFAIAAIHHALGGAPAGERIYAFEDAPSTAVADPQPVHAAAAAVPVRRERGGTFHRRLVPGLAALCGAVIVTILIAAHEPARVHDQVLIPGRVTATPLRTAAADVHAPSPPPLDLPQPGAALPAPPPTVSILDCAALWSELLPRCAALPKAQCANSDARLPREARERLAGLHAEVRGFDAVAFGNFCRAACRHGYRPARDDFVLTVCSARG